MRKIARIQIGIAFLVVGLLLSFLSFGRNTTTGPEDSTYIFIYRTGQFKGAGANWAIFVDGDKKCKLSNNRYMRIAVAPGKHMVTAKVGGAAVFKKETEVEVDAEAGGSYYIACNIKQSITRARLEMLEVTKGTANKQMEKMELDKCQEKVDAE